MCIELFDTVSFLLAKIVGTDADFQWRQGFEVIELIVDVQHCLQVYFIVVLGAYTN